MNDLISRHAALDAFGLSEKTRKYGGDHSGYDTMMLYEIQQTLENLPTVTPKQRWIPVSEGLPEEKQSVLVWCPQHKNIYCAYLEKEQWWIFGAFVQIVPNEVVAWMPLPKPYEPQESEEQA